MSSYRSYSERDDRELTTGDNQFLGVNARLSPDKLPPGMVSGAINKRFTNGRAATRLGIQKLFWTNRVVAEAVVPFGAIYGGGVFNDPDDQAWIIIAADGYVYRLREGNLASIVPLPTGVSITAPVFFVQAVTEFIMFRGADLDPLRMRDVDSGFETVTQASNTVTGASSENPADGTRVIPPAANALYLGNRLFVPHSRDLISASDYLNYTRYQPVRSTFRVNQGSSDALTALFKYDETTIIAAKAESIYRIRNVYGNLRETVLDEITREYGITAVRSFVTVGRDVWFLADRRGVCSITLTDAGKMQAVDVPVSQDIQPVIDRINWKYADGAVGAYADNKFYMAVPLDNAEVLRASVVPSGAAYDGSGEYALTVTAGRTYRWTPGANDLILVNGTETLVAPGDFTAQSTTVTLKRTWSDNFDTENDSVTAVENYDTFANWDVVNKVDLINAAYDAAFSSMGAQGFFVDTKGTVAGGFAEVCGITSKDLFALKAGSSYTLGFALAGSQRIYNQGVTVSAGGLLSENIDLDPGIAFADYTRVLSPTVDEDVVLDFRNYDPGADNEGLLLDDIFLRNGDGAAAAVTATVQHVITGANNAVLVFDFLRQRWAGYDQTKGRDLAVQDWIKHTYLGSVRLFFIGADGFLNLYEEGFEDELPDESDAVSIQPIEDELLTRGYSFDTTQPKRFTKANLQIHTWAPKYSVTAELDGVNEVKALAADIVRSRTAYSRPWDAVDWDPTNANDDHNTPYREDYSVPLAEPIASGAIANAVDYLLEGSGAILYNGVTIAAGATFAGTTMASFTTIRGLPVVVDSSGYIDPGLNGFNPDLHQEFNHPLRVGAQAAYVQLRIANTEGRCEISGVEIAARQGDRGSTKKG